MNVDEADGEERGRNPPAKLAKERIEGSLQMNDALTGPNNATLTLASRDVRRRGSGEK